MACGQNFNSHSGDERFSDDLSLKSCDSPADKRLCLALTVIRTNCNSCHVNWNKYKTDQDWVSSGLVIPQDLHSSHVVHRLINAGSDMPLYGAALSDKDYEALKDWVTHINVSEN